MGQYVDFFVKHDFKTESEEELSKKILYALFIKRIKGKKQTTTFIGGDSGEGKSSTAIALQMLLMEVRGIDIKKYLSAMNIYTPLQYAQKLNPILYDKSLKEADMICMHEAREVVKSKNWQSFLSQTVSDVNAMSRTVKRMNIFIVSQFIRDITTDIRYTLTYYGKVYRPIGKRARLYLYRMWKDDRDLEKPKLRKRGLVGYVVAPNGRAKKFRPQYFEMPPLPKDVKEMFEKEDFDAKSHIIKNKLNKLLKDLEKEYGDMEPKMNTMVEWYAKNPETLTLIGSQRKGEWRVKKEFKDMHSLDKDEAKDFEKRLNQQLKNKGVIKNES